MESPDPIARQLNDIHRTLAGETGGALADYIPDLARVDPNPFGIALVSLQGHVYRAGDADALFTIQSVSKPFVYTMALAEMGLDAVLTRVGVEPSGEAFNAISLEPGTGRPANPMINAGAILVTSLIAARDARERFGRILDVLSAFAGRTLDVDIAVYRSELATGDRNRALAYLMRGAGALEADVDETLDVYFRQCAVRASAVDIATMAATLANRGTNPVTGVRVVDAEVAAYVLTVMTTCGMYDASGNWLLRVGLPAKSGVSGAVMAASPGEFGIGVFSPRVDASGNSVRGVAPCEELASRFELQLLRRAGMPPPALYSLDVDEIALGASGWDGGPDAMPDLPANLVVRGLQGDLCFADAESLLRSFDALLRTADELEAHLIVLDLHRVGAVSGAAGGIIAGLVRDLAARGHAVATVDGPGRVLLDGVRSFPSMRDALLWAGTQVPAVRQDDRQKEG